MEDQQKLQEMVNELNVYKNQAELLQQQVEALQASLAEVRLLEATIDDMKGKSNVEALVPIGSGAFMKGEITDSSNVVISVGAGVAISKTPEEAKETLADQKNDLNISLDKTLEQLQKVTDVIGQLSPRAEQLMAKVQQQGMMPQ